MPLLMPWLVAAAPQTPKTTRPKGAHSPKEVVPHAVKRPRAVAVKSDSASTTPDPDTHACAGARAGGEPSARTQQPAGELPPAPATRKPPFVSPETRELLLAGTPDPAEVFVERLTEWEQKNGIAVAVTPMTADEVLDDTRLTTMVDEAITSTVLGPDLDVPVERLTRDQERSRRKHDVRATTISVNRLPKRELERGRALYPEDTTQERPRTRGDCEQGIRPCPFVSCKHNLYLDVGDDTGAIKLNRPELEPDEMKESCVLDVADRGGATLEEVGTIMNVTRERIRQIEVVALKKVEKADRRRKGVLAEYANPGTKGKRGPSGRRRYSNDERAALRDRAARMFAEGMSARDVAAAIHVNEDFVNTLVGEARALGADIPFRNVGYGRQRATEALALAGDDDEEVA